MNEYPISPSEEHPAPPKDSLRLYVEVDEEDVYFLDAVIELYDGVANVRREYRVTDGEKEFLIYTSPGLFDFTVDLIRDLRSYIYIGKIHLEGDADES